MIKLWMLTSALALAACSQIVGFKDPKLDEDSGKLNPDAGIDAMIDGPPGGATCKPADCPFGCDTATDKCRVGKLWVYTTAGAFNGAGFGGQDNPPNPRAGADATCRKTASDKYADRACNPNRVHAVLNISTADSIGTMASTFTIPTDVPVHRPVDDVLVADNWLALTDVKAPRAPVSNDADGFVWSGSSSSNCKGWTSALSTDNGVRGYANATFANWLARDSKTCDTFQRLLCVCWSGGQ